MWFFVSPQVIFGEGALAALDDLSGKRAMLVTDRTMEALGTADVVRAHLRLAGMEVATFARVEPEPSVATVLAGAEVARDFAPDWIVGLGGGSSLDAAKAIWVLYERPDLHPAEIDPLVKLGLRQKARLVTIPTTSGTGSEVTMGIVLTDEAEQRKMGLGNRENVADLAIVDPQLTASMPPRLTADSGVDALSHAVEAYTCAWHTDLTDGLCLRAVELIFANLPRAVANGSDMEARERMANAATGAGLALGNAMASLAHAMGHPLGATFHLSHGTCVGLLLPYTIEYAAAQAPERFAALAPYAGCATSDGEAGARAFAERTRALLREVGVHTSVAATGVGEDEYRARLEKLMDDAFNDTQMLTAVRCPSYDELRDLFRYAYRGQPIDF